MPTPHPDVINCPTRPTLDGLECRLRPAFAVGATIVLLALSGVLAAPRHAGAQTVDSVVSLCVDCHDTLDPARLASFRHGDAPSCLTCHHIGFADDAGVGAVRQLDACVSCHGDVAPAHVEAAGGAPSCTDCHSIHGGPGSEEGGGVAGRCRSCHTTKHALHAAGDEDPPTCVDCHIAHREEAFDVGRDVAAKVCAACHEGAHATHMATGAALVCTRCHAEDGLPGTAAARPATARECVTCHSDLHSAHGEVAAQIPSCVGCHDFGGDVPLAEDVRPTVARCVSCHLDAMAAFMEGPHPGTMTGGPARDLANCLPCHTSHPAGPGSNPSPRLAATDRCLECHAPGGIAGLGRSYTSDFHGATAAFVGDEETAGGPPVLACTDCHGPHRVEVPDGATVAAVCLRCHTTGNPRLAGAWLGHAPIGPRNQPVIWLIRLSYYVLIPFMLTGLGLNILFHLVDRRRAGARVMETSAARRLVAWVRRAPPDTPAAFTVQRFTLGERLEHAASALAFILLVLTGLPQTRPDLAVARRIVGLLGGIGATRLVHRIVGFAFLLLLATHVARAITRALRRRRLPAMVPTPRDFVDVLQTFRHYLFGQERPPVGRFDFAEKFEYWGLFLGAIVMGTTGAVLVFPGLASQALPGVAIAAARVIHGFEAAFAVSVVILWHSYGVILRPEVFPLDTSMLTGRISLDRLREEHPLEYERLVGPVGTERTPESSGGEEE